MAGRLATYRTPSRSWVPTAALAGSVNELAFPDAAEHDHRRGVGDRIYGEGVSGSDGVDQHATDGRSDERTKLEDRRVQADRVAEVIGSHHLVHERLAGRIVQCGDQAKSECDDEDVPRLHPAGESQRGQRGAHRCHPDLGSQEDAPLGVSVGDEAAGQAEHQRRHELEGGRDADVGGAAGEAQHQPVLRDALHPGAGVGHHLTGCKQPEVPGVQ